MSRRRAWVVLVLSLAPASLEGGCGSGSSPTRVNDGTPLSDSGLEGTSDDAADTGAPVSDSSTASDAGTDVGVDGGGTDSAVLDTGAGPDVGPPEDGSAPGNSVCDPTDTFSTVTRVPSIAASGFDRFGSVSANGNTVAWTTTAGLVFVADRTSAQAAFGTPVQLATGTTQLANDRVALDPLGLKLVATLAGGSSFVSFVRSSVGSAWAVSLYDEYKFISAVEGGGTFSEPVLSLDELSLFYLVQAGSNPPVLVESPWDVSMKAWATGVDLPNPEFAITGAAQVRRPTGASSDRRTLFFFDEVAGKERTAWRNSPAEPFDYFADLPQAPEAVPSDICDTLYFHGSDSNGQGLFTAQ